MEPFRIGMISDTHYADQPVRIGRYYRNALKKALCCLRDFQAEHVDCVIHLGDVIDCPGEPEKGREALQAFLSETGKTGIPFHFAIGNHDVATLPCEELTERLDFPDRHSWYAFDRHGVHFVILDSNFDANGERYRPGYEIWDQCHIPAREAEWLKNDLEKTRLNPCVILVHALLDDWDNRHVIRNAAEIRKILEKSGKQIVVLQGHKHDGNESRKNGIGYYTIPSLVNGYARRRYWILEGNGEELLLRRFDTSLRHGAPSTRVILRV